MLDPEPVTLLIASPYEPDHRAIGEALARFSMDWTLISVQGCREAWVALHSAKVDVILVDTDQCDACDWRDLIDEVADMHTHQPVIVSSTCADDSLWAEVLNLGGFDVLAKPFDSDEVARVLAMAARHARSLRSHGDTQLMPAGIRTEQLYMSRAVANCVAQSPGESSLVTLISARLTDQ